MYKRHYVLYIKIKRRGWSLPIRQFSTRGEMIEKFTTIGLGPFQLFLFYISRSWRVSVRWNARLIKFFWPSLHNLDNKNFSQSLHNSNFKSGNWPFINLQKNEKMQMNIDNYINSAYYINCWLNIKMNMLVMVDNNLLLYIYVLKPNWPRFLTFTLIYIYRVLLMSLKI